VGVVGELGGDDVGVGASVTFGDVSGVAKLSSVLVAVSSEFVLAVVHC